VVALVAGSAGFAVAQNPGGTSDYANGTETGVRPTGVGLPLIGESGTVGASEFPNTLRAYHDSGQYDGAHADRDFKLPNPFYFISD
jgi:hypothetical protein